ncbi:MAG: ABC transporter permease, partial [Rickettsiales bacterium]|nr:ABC transporter permease [Rickettsiales bacterium]
DDVSLVGVCPHMVLGDPLAIQRPQNAMMDQNGYFFTWPGQKVQIGKQIELNDNRLTINAICDVMPTFFTFPILYVSYETALEITPPGRKKLPFVLVKAAEGENIEALKARITEQTGLQALTKNEFAWRSINYILERTGIPINFGITIVLGVIIGVAITAQTFNIFIVENMKQFAALKAIGVTNRQLLSIVMTQAGIVGATGYGLGIGFTAIFFAATANTPALKGFVLHWQIMAGSAVVIALIILFSITFSLRRVFTLDPALVFRG